MYPLPFTRASKWGLTRASTMRRRLSQRRSIHNCITPIRRRRAIKAMRPVLLPPALAEAKALYNKALKALEAAKLAVTTAGVKPFELYGNLLSDKARQPWEKIIKPKVTRAPWEDIKGVPHMETPTKTWDSFHECIMFHLLQVFCHDAGETLKYYITNS
eukprot:CCRYP_017976-RA/>CCRYP_017976-RA protein AED:0.44 eAED:0.44 QI:103/1/1/1/0/0/2/35/158